MITVASKLAYCLQYKESSMKKKYPAGNYMLKVNNRNNRARCEIYTKLTTFKISQNYAIGVVLASLMLTFSIDFVLVF